MVILPINKLSCSEENKCAGQNMSLIISRICSKDSFWDINTVPRLLWFRCYQKICVFILTISWKMNLEQIGLSKMSWLEITSVWRCFEILFFIVLWKRKCKFPHMDLPYHGTNYHDCVLLMFFSLSFQI